ncbi:mmge/prpd family protein-like protein [Mollisia scopiformis]|uniref:Mmge/prpd family protein-like protein n=1 Tax=Mollisia scopiformis TaxID=149040 RepID=A0A194X0E6_MOLSC|nr:mmge/prpd family protein-like protein [Mollisia scopiformis]KUJ13671.1 mmge/prpd family protein-like protein [Mollisia scopiformis]
MATHHLASWACSLKYSDMPQNVIQAAVRSFYNWAGCAIGGSKHPATTIAHNSLSPFFGPPTASLLGHQGKTKIDAQHAALLNGIASHVHDYDDTHLDTIIHPTGPVASALLAVAEWKGGFSGKDFLLALIVGIEAECKVGLAVWPEHYDVGWHITSTTGSIGAAVAVSKLLGLSISQTTNAIGVAATQVVGLREMFGSHTKSFHPGRAAQSGLMAAVLAEGGYTSSEQALEAKRGWANVVGVTKPGIAADLDKWLGMNAEASEHGVGLFSAGVGRWEILRNSFKPFPCGIVIHPIIDASTQIHGDMKTQGLDAQNIKSVHAKVHPLVLELTGKRKPKDGLEGKFSVFHGAAIGLIYGKGTPSEYEDHVVQDAKVIAIRDKVNAESDKSLGADETIVVATMSDGKILERHVKHAVGSLEVPMDDGMLQRKFVDQCAAVLGDRVQAASEICWDIEYAKDVADVAKLL